MKSHLITTRSIIYLVAITGLLCIIDAAQAHEQTGQSNQRKLPGLLDYSKDYQAESCPNAWPNVNTRYYRELRKLDKQDVSMGDPHYFKIAQRQDTYMNCAQAIMTDAAVGLAAFGNNNLARSVDRPTQPLAHVQKTWFRGASPPFGDLELKAVAMGYRGKSIEETTRALFCKCLAAHLDGGLSAALGEEPDGD